MRLSESFLLALQNIRKSKGRSFLTMLGIIIGIAAVMVIIGLGSGMKNYMKAQFESVGTNTLTVMITGRGSSSTVTPDDLYEIVADDPAHFELLSPTVSVQGSVKIGAETLDSTTATGVSESYFDISNYTVESGRNLRYMDMQSRARVCVVGSYINDVWFSGKAVGQTLRIGGNVYTIVGTLAQEDDEAEEGGTDDAVYLPYTTAARLGGMSVSTYTVTIVDEEMASEAQQALKDALYERLRSDNAYMVQSMASLLDMMTQMINVVITVLAVIAAISLVVGGVGIMNIMLVSVSERTREIGIRKALGAKERYILVQFVIEAAVLSGLGGIFGIAVGFGLSSLATIIVTALIQETITVTPTISSICIAFGASAAIGIIFGFLPARRAAALNPIDALHYE